MYQLGHSKYISVCAGIYYLQYINYSNNISLPEIFLDRSAAAVNHRVCPMNGRGHGPGGYRCLSHTGQLYNIHNTTATVTSTGNTLTLSARGS